MLNPPSSPNVISQPGAVRCLYKHPDSDFFGEIWITGDPAISPVGFMGAPWMGFTLLDNGDTLVTEEAATGRQTGRAMIVRFADPEWPDADLQAPEDRDPHRRVAYDVVTDPFILT